MTRAPLIALVLAVACVTLTPERTAPSIRSLTTEAGVCTAWSAGKAQWITAGHCVALGGGSIDTTRANVLAVDSHDVALVSGPVAPALSVAKTAPPIGATVDTYGYAAGTSVLLLFRGTVMQNSAILFSNDQSAEMLIGGANGMPGMSGGPILYRGAVVSVITGGGTATSPAHLIGGGVPWDALAAFVQAHVK